jgi:hypothetical protein
MTDYTKTTNFTAKDGLTTGDSAKVVRGTEMDVEFDAIQVAVATKHDTAGLGITVTSGSVAVDVASLAAVTPVGADLLLISDDSDSDAPKSCTLTQLTALVGNATDIVGLDKWTALDQSSDWLIFYDESDAVNEKIEMSDLLRLRVQTKTTGEQLGTNWKQTHTAASSTGQTFEIPLDSTYDFDTGTMISFFCSAGTNYIDVASNSTTCRGPLGLITTSTPAIIALGGTVVLRKLSNDYWSITGDYTV